MWNIIRGYGICLSREDGLVVTDNLITGFIPLAALKTQGTQPVSIADTNTGSSVHIGFLTIAR